LNNFIKLIPISHDFTAQFFFHKTNAQTGLRYYISVIGKDNHSHVFVMEHLGESWQIVLLLRVPEWIRAVEKELSNAIIEHTLGRDSISS
jgi:hypothetical protein